MSKAEHTESAPPDAGGGIGEELRKRIAWAVMRRQPKGIHRRFWATEDWFDISDAILSELSAAGYAVVRREFMDSIEWAADPINGDDYCQWCGQWRKTGHSQICGWRQAMLQASEGERI